MYLVSRRTRARRSCEAWKYPLPGDSVIFRIQRVVIDLDAAGGPRVVRLQMPPDAAPLHGVRPRLVRRRHLRRASGIRTAHTSRSSPSSRDHKQAWFRVADANTGDVRTLFEETSPTQFGDAARPRTLARAARVERVDLVVAARQLDAPLSLRPRDRPAQEPDHRRATATSTRSCASTRRRARSTSSGNGQGSRARSVLPALL